MYRYKTSTDILERILNKNADREVAWLNLADAYWNQNNMRMNFSPSPPNQNKIIICHGHRQ